MGGFRRGAWLPMKTQTPDPSERPVRRSLLLLLVSLLLLAGLAAGGLALSHWLTPERLREEAERRLTELTGQPVHIARVELALGVGIQLRGEGLELFPLPDGPGLRVERIGVGIEPLALLAGRFRLRRMHLEGAELRIVQAPDGRFHAPFGFLDHEPGGEAESEALLRPLIVFETAMRFLLERPYLADSLWVERSRVRLELGAGAKPQVFSLAIRDGQLLHRPLRGDAVLSMQGRLADGLGDVRWTGTRDRGGELEVSLGFQDLDLAALQRYVRGLTGLAGKARGTLALSSPEPGSGHLGLDLHFDGLEARLPEDSAWGPLRADQLEADAALEISPQQLKVESARVRSGDLQLELAGSLQRPLQPASTAGLELTFRDIDVARVRALLDWLPHSEADRFETFVAPVVSGRLQRFTARGAAQLADWEEFFAGRRPIVAMGIGAEAEVADVVLQVGAEDRIENLGGRISWNADRVEVAGARASLNGEPLPGLDLVFDGVSNLLQVPPERRRLESGALPLPGVQTLWQVLRGREEEADAAAAPLALDLEIDRLHHPVFLWPLEHLRVDVRSQEGGLQLGLRQGSWAGVPIQGEVDWLFEPELHARVALRASPPPPDAAPPLTGPGWASGRFRMGAVDQPGWQQKQASGAFRASAGMLHLDDVSVALEPAGRLQGSASLDLSQRDAVPFTLSAELSGGDVASLVARFAPEAKVASGRLDAWGSFSGTLRPDTSPLADLDGLLEIAAADGEIHRSLPPIVSIALASESLNPFADRESIRYRSAGALLQFRDGKLSTDEFSIDGPDLRMVASGSVGLLKDSHEIRAEVALFLFRQLDRAVGSIPLVNLLLLGPDQNLLAAYFKLSGPWNEPKSRLVPLKSLATGPASLVMEGVPSIVQRGLRAIGAVVGGGDRNAEADPTPPPGPATAPWRETPWGS
jgi:hypothetical protein